MPTVCEFNSGGLVDKLSSPSTEPEKIEPEPRSLDISSLDLYQLLDVFVVLLSEQAWRYLGLTEDSAAKEGKKDMVKAHLAIDCIISLVDKMEPNLDSKDKDRLRSLITTLQMKYVQQMKG